MTDNKIYDSQNLNGIAIKCLVGFNNDVPFALADGYDGLSFAENDYILLYSHLDTTKVGTPEIPSKQLIYRLGSKGSQGVPANSFPLNIAPKDFLSKPVVIVTIQQGSFAGQSWIGGNIGYQANTDITPSISWKPFSRNIRKEDIVGFVETDYVHRTGDESVSGTKTFGTKISGSIDLATLAGGLSGAPGNNKYYGTDALGNKGFYDSLIANNYYTKSQSDAITNALIPNTQKGANNGVAPLDATGKIPLANIPSTYLGAKVVNNIAARNAITPLYDGLLSHVIDASADVTVGSGPAGYIYQLSTASWSKVYQGSTLAIDLGNYYTKTESQAKFKNVIALANDTNFNTIYPTDTPVAEWGIMRYSVSISTANTLNSPPAPYGTFWYLEVARMDTDRILQVATDMDNSGAPNRWYRMKSYTNSGNWTAWKRTATDTDIAALNTAVTARVQSSQVGAANGVAPLDATGQIPLVYIPNNYLGAKVVDNIAQRNGITPLYDGLLSHVIDATADTTVDSGSAGYIYQLSTASWSKVYQGDTLDFSFSNYYTKAESLSKFKNVIPLGSDYDFNYAFPPDSPSAEWGTIDYSIIISTANTFNSPPASFGTFWHLEVARIDADRIQQIATDMDLSALPNKWYRLKSYTNGQEWTAWRRYATDLDINGIASGIRNVTVLSNDYDFNFAYAPDSPISGWGSYNYYFRHNTRNISNAPPTTGAAASILWLVETVRSDLDTITQVATVTNAGGAKYYRNRYFDGGSSSQVWTAWVAYPGSSGAVTGPTGTGQTLSFGGQTPIGGIVPTVTSFDASSIRCYKDQFGNVSLIGMLSLNANFGNAGEIEWLYYLPSDYYPVNNPVNIAQNNIWYTTAAKAALFSTSVQIDNFGNVKFRLKATSAVNTVVQFHLNGVSYRTSY